MNLKRIKLIAGILAIVCLVLVAGTQSYAHRHGESKHAYQAGYEKGGREGGASGATGVLAAWLFGIANFPVVLSILLKAGGKMTAQGSNSRLALEKANRRQKRYLMNLHYWLNPFAAGAAILHFSLAECRSTLIPELGLGMMLLIIVLGLMMTFRLSPASMKKAVFRLHTSPVSTVAAIVILMIGHSLVD